MPARPCLTMPSTASAAVVAAVLILAAASVPLVLRRTPGGGKNGGGEGFPPPGRGPYGRGPYGLQLYDAPRYYPYYPGRSPRYAAYGPRCVLYCAGGAGLLGEQAEECAVSCR